MSDAIDHMDGGILFIGWIVGVVMGFAIAALEQNIAIAAKMYECRDTARRLLRDLFEESMADRARIIGYIMHRDKCNEIVAGATAIKENSAGGMDSVLWMACVVEMVEPSNAANRRG